MLIPFITFWNTKKVDWDLFPMILCMIIESKMDSANGLVPEGTKPLAEPMLTKISGPVFYLISWVKYLGKSLGLVFDPK